MECCCVALKLDKDSALVVADKSSKAEALCDSRDVRTHSHPLDNAFEKDADSALCSHAAYSTNFLNNRLG